MINYNERMILPQKEGNEFRLHYQTNNNVYVIILCIGKKSFIHEKMVKKLVSIFRVKNDILNNHLRIIYELINEFEFVDGQTFPLQVILNTINNFEKETK